MVYCWWGPLLGSVEELIFSISIFIFYQLISNTDLSSENLGWAYQLVSGFSLKHPCKAWRGGANPQL